MKRIITLLFTLFITAISVSAQEYEIMRTQNGTMVYSVGDGTWLPREAWIEKFGRKTFRSIFPYPNYFDHFVEQGYIRTYVQKSFKNVVGGDIQWSRVLESNKSIELLKREAASKLNDVIYEDEESISGVIEDRSFVPDHRGRYFLMYSYLWRANVTYEFRDGRYRVTLSNIYCGSTASLSLYSGLGFSVNSGDVPEPLSNFLYVYDIDGYNEYWLSVSNFFDRNFTAAVILSSIYEENNTDNDW